MCYIISQDTMKDLLKFSFNVKVCPGRGKFRALQVKLYYKKNVQYNSDIGRTYNS